MFDAFREGFREELDSIREAGTFKEERVISSPQSAAIEVPQGEVINFCANNYLGLADNPEIIARAKQALDERGFGMASVRFICGTQDLHKQLEGVISRFNGTDDTILYSSCFDANAGLFETILGGEDAIISDQLNHASIIDGVRLCKAERFRYANSDMGELEEILERTQDHRRRLIASDGVIVAHRRGTGQAVMLVHTGDAGFGAPFTMRVIQPTRWTVHAFGHGPLQGGQGGLLVSIRQAGLGQLQQVAPSLVTPSLVTRKEL